MPPAGALLRIKTSYKLGQITNDWPIGRFQTEADMDR